MFAISVICYFVYCYYDYYYVYLVENYIKFIIISIYYSFFFGKFIDGFVGEVSYLILFISITIFLYKDSDMISSILSFLIGISFVVHSSYFNRKNKLIMEMNIVDDNITLSKDSQSNNETNKKRSVKRLVSNIKEILMGLFPYLLVISLVFGFFTSLIYIMSLVFIINFLHIFYDLKLSYSKLNKFRNF